MFARPKSAWRHEFGALLALAAPIALAQLAQIAMSIADTLIVAPLGATAIAAVGLGHNAFFGFVWPLINVLLCLDTETSQAVGRNDERAATRALAQSVTLMLGVALVGTFAVYALGQALEAVGVHAEVAPLSRQYLQAMLPGILPLAFTFAASKFLQAHGKTTPVVVIALLANVMNFILVSGLVHGRFGLPALGIAGAGIGTSICRWLYALAYVWVLVRGGFGFVRRDFLPQKRALLRMLSLGVPAALQVGLEAGIFFGASFMIARFAPATLAAHNILLQIATLTFMVPLGISAAAAVRVGQAVGAGDAAAAVSRGWVAIAFSAMVMTVSGALLIALGGSIVLLFDAPLAVTQAFVGILGFASAFQTFDGIQVTATGALRGLGDTRAPFVANLIGHWLIAFPLALVFGFARGMEARGVWLALMVGLVSVALGLLWVWQVRAKQLTVVTASDPAAGASELDAPAKPVRL